MPRHKRKPGRTQHRAKGLNSFKKNKKVKRGNAITRKIEPQKSQGFGHVMSLVIEQARIGGVRG